MNRVSKVLMIAAASMAMTGTAFADDPAPDAGGGASGEASAGAGASVGAGGATVGAGAEVGVEGNAMVAGANSLTLGAGKILIAGSTFNMSLSAGAVGKPFSLAPSLYYGVSDKLTLGVSHDGGTTTFSPRPAPGAGICLAGKKNGCEKPYNNIGFDALFGLAQGKFSVAAHPGVDILRISDPLLVSLRLGVLGRYEVAPKFAIVFDPSLRLGLTKRDLGNKEFLNVPVYAWIVATPKVGVYATTGIAGPTSGFGDGYTIPVGAGATFASSEKLSIGADFLFTNLAGKGSSADGRALGVRVAFAL